MGAALHCPLGQRSIDSRPASTCCTLRRGDVDAAVSVRVRPGTRVRRDGLRSQSRGRFAGRDKRAPENRRQAAPSRKQRPAVPAERENDGAANRASTQARNGLTKDHAGVAERQTLGFRRGQT